MITASQTRNHLAVIFPPYKAVQLILSSLARDYRLQAELQYAQAWDDLRYLTRLAQVPDKVLDCAFLNPLATAASEAATFPAR